MLARRNLSLGVRMFLAILLAIFCGFPIYWMINTSMTPSMDIYSGGQTLVPDFRNAGGVVQVLFTESPFLKWMGNSGFIAFGVTFLSLIMASMAAYALARYRFVGKGPMAFMFFATQMLPEALLVVPLYTLFSSLGLLNKLGGLVLVNTVFAMPVAVFLLKSAIENVPYEVEESARLDGCRPYDILSIMVMPLIMPSLAAAAVITFFDGWNEYLFATTFIRDKELWAASTGLASYIGEFDTPLDRVFSAAVVFTLPAVIFFLMMQRRIVSGLTAGSVKG